MVLYIYLFSSSKIQTIYRRIRSLELFSFRPHLGLLLKEDHQHQRLQWCSDHLEWNGNGTPLLLVMNPISV